MDDVASPRCDDLWMKLIHLYTGDDGRSHFADLELDLAPGPYGVGIDLESSVQGLSFREVEPRWSADFHCAPRRQIVFQLTGSGEIMCGDGSSRVLGPGDVLLADDLTGEGHQSREVSGPRTQAVVYLDPALDLRTLRRPST